MNRVEAIQECKKLWKEIEESGVSKEIFIIRSKQGKVWRNKKYVNDCPLCNYAYVFFNCPKCPLVEQYGEVTDTNKCYELGFEDSEIPSKEWLTYIYNLKEE